MELHLVRHAIAVPKSDPAFDHARPLSTKGRERFAEVVAGLEKLGRSFDRIYYSPWVRARQTAEMLSALGGELVPLDSLAAPPSDELYAAIKGEAVALVGHEPWLGELCAVLVTGKIDLGVQFALKKGGVAHLVGVPAPSGSQLVAFYPPSVLRAIGS